MNKTALIVGGAAAALLYFRGSGVTYPPPGGTLVNTPRIATQPTLIRTPTGTNSIIPTGGTIPAGSRVLSSLNTSGTSSSTDILRTIVQVGGIAVAAVPLVLKALTIGEQAAKKIVDLLPETLPTSGWEGVHSITTAEGVTVFSDGSVVLPNGAHVAANGTVTPPADAVTITPSTPASAVTLPPGPPNTWDTLHALVTPEGHTVFSDGTVILIDGTVLPPDGSIILGHTPTAITRDAILMQAEGSGYEIIGDGVKLYNNGVQLYPDGRLYIPDGTGAKLVSTVGELTAAGLGDYSLNDLEFVFSPDMLADIPMQSFADTAVMGVSVSDVMTLLEIAGPWLKVAGLGLTIALSDTHTTAGQAQVANAVASAMGSIVGAAVAGTVGSFAGGLVALPIIIGSIFGSSLSPRQMDPVQEGVISSGGVAVISEIVQGLTTAVTPEDYAEVFKILPPSTAPRPIYDVVYIGPDQYMEVTSGWMLTLRQAMGYDPPPTGLPALRIVTQDLVALIDQGVYAVTAHLANAYNLDPIATRYFQPLLAGGQTSDEGGSTAPLLWDTVSTEIHDMAAREALGLPPVMVPDPGAVEAGYGAGGG